MFECMGKECALNSYGADQVKLLTSFVIKDLQKKNKKTPKNTNAGVITPTWSN